MGATADTIWRVPAYLPYLQLPITPELVSVAEKKIGHPLPEEYLALLRMQNGGYIRYSLPEKPHDSIYGIGSHRTTFTGFDWDDCQEHVSFSLDGLVPFDGDGHWHVCLDYRSGSDTPSITYVEIDRNRQTELAASFASYLALLQIDVDNEYVLEAVSDIEIVKQYLSNTLRISFEPASPWANGYPVHRAKLGTATRPDWIWISPNTVPRGFVRKDDTQYEQLKDLMPGQADRYPGLPPESFIIGATDGVRTKVIDAAKASGFTVRPLQEYIAG